MLNPIPFALGTALMIVVSAAWMLASAPLLGAVAIAVFPLLLVVNFVYQRRADRWYDAAQAELGKLSAGVHESFEGVQLVKAYGAEERETQRLGEIAARLRNDRVRAVELRGTFEALLDALPSLTNVLLVVVGAYQVRDGAVTVGELSSFVYLFTLLVFPLRIIGYALSEVPYSLAGWDRVRGVLDEQIVADPRAKVTRVDTDEGVQLADVTFAYPGDGGDVLHDVDLNVPAGRVVALVGPTGAGKTTLLNVTGGLLEPQRGTVATVDDATIVFQEPFLFAGTIAENVGVGLDVDETAVWEALRFAEAERFVRSLPDQLATVVGERGVSLSGGQRQRVALARALVRRPRLLLLDDTTSALDPATERAVLGNLRSALADTTVLMVASRPSTIALADDVIYLRGGRVVDHGRHAELLAGNADYAELIAAFETDRDSSDAEASR